MILTLASSLSISDSISCWSAIALSRIVSLIAYSYSRPPTTAPNIGPTQYTCHVSNKGALRTLDSAPLTPRTDLLSIDVKANGIVVKLGVIVNGNLVGWTLWSNGASDGLIQCVDNTVIHLLSLKLFVITNNTLSHIFIYIVHYRV